MQPALSLSLVQTQTQAHWYSIQFWFVDYLGTRTSFLERHIAVFFASFMGFSADVKLYSPPLSRLGFKGLSGQNLKTW